MTSETEHTTGFWARQFASEVTPRQLVFDALFGVVLPVVCLLADPIVFKGSDFLGGGVLRRYAIGAYLFIGGSVLGLALWLTLRRFPLLFAGPFLAGAVVAAVLGALLSPYSLVTLLMGIGFLGLVPFGTAFAFLRNGVRALRLARPRTTGVTRVLAVTLTAFLAVGVPAGANAYLQLRIADAVSDVASDDVDRREAGLDRLRVLGRFTSLGADLDRIVWDWHEEVDPERKARIARGYEAATGRNIASRWGALVD